MPREIQVKSVLNKIRKRDDWFLCDYTLNLYSSCSFNCLYCYIRGSKYGSNLESALSVKVNAIEILEKQLQSRAKKGQYGIIVLSSATDPYLSIEEHYQLTRKALEVILHYRFPVHIITKSHRILRDLDVLRQIDEKAILPDDLLDAGKGRGVIVSFSFSTLQDEMAAIFEPGATLPTQRLTTMQTIKREGFFTGVSLMPLLPFLSDTTEQLEHAFSTFQSCNVDYVLPATLTLFGTSKADSKVLMLNAIQKHYPHLHNRYLKYFEASNEMPAYYRHAFYNKMKELTQQYGLNPRILF